MEPSVDDGFKWFGEGFDGFPKHLPEDTVEYSLYLIDEKLQDNASLKQRLNDINKEVKRYVADLTKDYIWQRDTFDLRLADKSRRPKQRPTEQPSTTYLGGRTAFGDAIADEWLIVYILVELSKQYKDAWITVTDSDDEFLLIEAAAALPKWLDPDVASNRIWISNGHLRIIPLEDKSTATRAISREDALSFIKTRQQDLIIDPFIEDAAFRRVKTYPAAIEDSLHHALITIPRQVAYLLHQNPAYISPAVEAFYIRDLISLKPLQSKDLATLNFPPEDFVTTSVKFTKVNYAQLRSQVFEAPPSWTGVAPRLHDERLHMGMKLTCGFEMLLADPANKDSKTVREMRILLDDIMDGEVELPDDKEITTWSTRQDSEKWLDVDYADFEAELSGKGTGKAKGDTETQDSIREMVDRFQKFVNDDTAGADDASDEDTESTVSSTGKDKEGSFDETEFEQAMKEMMGMSDSQKQDSGLLDEARKLAIDDGEDEVDIDEETQEMMRMMEKELKGHGALQRGKKPAKKTVMFGPEPPPGLRPDNDESANEEVGPGDLELSSDDEDFNDVDVNLARNLLQSFKGQAGVSGPAGNMLKALGMTLPRDEDE